jgi:alanine dehydrogenase
VIIAVPKEIKPNEYRVAVTPAAVELLTSRGHRVLIQSGAGQGSGIPDDHFSSTGAEIVPDAEQAYADAEMILKVKEIFPREFDYLREGLVIFSFIHSANNPEQTQALLDKRVVAIACEDIVTDDGTAPMLTPMSEIAGETGMLMGVFQLFTLNGGPGKLIGGAVGVDPCCVAILGAGNVGLGAARCAVGLGARVILLDIDPDRLRAVRRSVFPGCRTLYLNPYNVNAILPEVDVLVNAVKWPPGSADHIVTREMLQRMAKDSLIVDISCDPAGAVETCRPTTHADPVYEVDGIRHYCVDNLPAAVARTASYALSNAGLDYAVQIADKGWLRAVKENAALRRGLGFAYGHLTFEPAARAQNRPYTPPERIIESFASGSA